MKRILRLLAPYIVSLPILSFAISCNKLVDVPLPIDKVTAGSLFVTDASATSAVLGIYSQMISPYLHLSCGAVTIYTGLSSDELTSTSATEATDNEFSGNSISTDNTIVRTAFWMRPYICIYQINACISGLTESTTLTPSVKNQLLGECKFARAFIYFYMTGLFGDVPLQTTTNYEINKRIPRTPVNQIKAQILTDLKESITLLTPKYPTSGPVRPNSYTAAALLARYYLYEKKWQEAETTASLIIDSRKYSLNNNLNNVFLANSNEAIWQLVPVNTIFNTFEGNSLIPNEASPAPPEYTITKYLMNAFEKGDKRLSCWTNYKVINNDTFYFPYKYKIALSSTSNEKEYYTVFRVAEQYLIRAEARAEQNNIIGAINDLNLLRNRSRDEAVQNALPPIPPSFNREETLAAIKQENRIELFCEWGHRWFDLIRHNEADKILSSVKPGWKSTGILYPIPFEEIQLNTTLTQNPGYN